MITKYIDNKGFTLIELLIVIAIISILSAIGGLASKDMIKTYRLRGAARQVFSDMQYARINAIKGGRTWTVSFDVDNQSYSVRNNVTGEGRTVDLKVDASRFIKMCNAENSVFKPNGTTDVPAPNVTISIESDVKKVYVSSPGTGNVRIVSPRDDASIVPCP